MLDQMRTKFTNTVKDAFEDLSYPESTNIVHERNLDADEAIKTLNAFKGRSWQEITLETLISNRDNLPFFTPQAFRCYLPAYMTATIVHYEHVDVLSNNTLYSLTPPEAGMPWQKEFSDRMSSFNKAQRSAIGEFLQLYAKLSPDSFQYDPAHHLERAIRFWQETE